MTNLFLSRLLHQAALEGYGFQIYGIGEMEPDYEGSSAKEAYDHIMGQDEAIGYLWKGGAAVDFAHYIPENEDEEVICDCTSGGFHDRYGDRAS